MPEIADQLVNAAGLLAPGFIAMKLFYVFGAQRQRSQWEWTTWAVLISLPIDWAARTAAPSLARLTASPSTEPVFDVAVRLALALSGALLAIAAWRYMKRSKRDPVVWLRRALTDSAWDEVTDEAVNLERYIEVVTATPKGDEVFYRGWLSTVGREDSRAEPWLYLRDVTYKSRANAVAKPLAGTDGLLIHRDHIRRVVVEHSVHSDDP
jgi:hypothetical protein